MQRGETPERVSPSAGCCAEGWHMSTPRRGKTYSATDLFVSYSFARLDSLRSCSRSSMGKTTSRGRCLLLLILLNWQLGLGFTAISRGDKQHWKHAFELMYLYSLLMHRLCASTDTWGYSGTSEGALIGQEVFGGISFTWLRRTIAINHPSFSPQRHRNSFHWIYFHRYFSLTKKKKEEASHSCHTQRSASVW